jgi:hypothetical protein
VNDNEDGVARAPFCAGCGQGILNMLEQQHPGQHALHINVAAMVLASLLHHTCDVAAQEKVLSVVRQRIAEARIGTPMGRA